MRSFLASALFLLAALGPAEAGSYEDFNTGIAAARRGQHDLAIQMLSRALAAGDLSPGLQPVAHYDRGLAYLAKDRPEAAIADFTRAIELKPDFFEAYAGRGAAHWSMGRREAALAEYNTVIRLQPKAVRALFTRGRLYWELGQFPQAASDLKEAATLAPSDPYFALWWHIAAARAGPVPPGELSQMTRKASLSKWPGPILKLFLGRLTPDQVREAAGNGDAMTQKHQDCGASFYIAQWHLLSGRPADAKPLLQSATASCPREFIELRAATVELNRLP
jgi:lipoprotein NlpI